MTNRNLIQLSKTSLKVRASIVPTSVNDAERTFEVTFTTGARVRRYDWFGQTYFEELEVSEDAVLLDRANAGAPFLKDHWPTVDTTLGVINRAWIENGEGRAEIKLSKHHEDADRIWGDIVDGVLRNVSVGYDPMEYIEMPPTADGVPVYRSKQWEPYEISLVSIPADYQAQVRARTPEEKPFEIKVRKIQQTNIPSKGEDMTKEEFEKQLKDEREAREKAEKAVSEKEAEGKRNADVAALEARKAEKARIISIRQAAKLAQLDEKEADELIASDLTVEQARDKCFEKMEKRQAMLSPAAKMTVNDVVTTEQRNEAIVESIMHRGMPGQVQLSDHAREYRGMSLLRIAEEILEASNIKTRNLTKSQLAVRALATGDFPILLGNVARKSLRKAYELQKPSFWAFVTRGTLPDYKETGRIQFGDVTSLKKVPEGDDYEYGSIGEAQEKIKLAKYGRIISITEEMIVNDDLYALVRLPAMLAAAAARVESKLVYTDTLVANPFMADTFQLFDNTNHGNNPTAAAITETSLGVAEKCMMDQKTLDKEDYLNLAPKFLITGTAKKVEGQKILANIVSTKSGDVNPFQNAMQLIVDPRITGNKWFLAADPSQIDTIEVAYLEGEEGPEILETLETKADVVNLKVKHVVAVKAIDYRGLVYNAGA